MRTALDVHRALLGREVPHEVVRLRRRLTTSDDLPLALGPGVNCLAVRLYRVSRSSRAASWAAVLVPAGAVPDPGSLLQALDAEAVRPASAAETNAVTGFANGLVSPVCLPDDVEVLADSALGTADVVYAAAGEPSVALGIRLRDLLVAVGARAAALTSMRVAPQPRFADIIDLDRTAPLRTGQSQTGQSQTGRRRHVGG